MLQTRIRERGHLCEFLPKFHCDINWAENHWGKSKPCVRNLVDGGWMKMYQAVWLSFGRKNISEVLAMRFARKVRETIGMYLTGMDCLFTEYCQRLFNQHRLPFYDANSLAKWEVNSPATAIKYDRAKKRHFCRITAINLEQGTCSVKFNGGMARGTTSICPQGGSRLVC